MADYLALLRDLSALHPPLFVFGSVAEAALLDGKLAASHGDLDVLISRSELEVRLRQLNDLGFPAFTVYYEPRPGLPVVYGSTREELVLELSIFDIDPAGHPYFVVGTDNGPVSISVPPDLFQWSPTIIDGVPVRTLSPLALVHIRAGATSTGAFGPTRPETDDTRHNRVIDVFLSNVDPAQLEPTITLISEPQ